MGVPMSRTVKYSGIAMLLTGGLAFGAGKLDAYVMRKEAALQNSSPDVARVINLEKQLSGVYSRVPSKGSQSVDYYAVVEERSTLVANPTTREQYLSWARWQNVEHDTGRLYLISLLFFMVSTPLCVSSYLGTLHDRGINAMKEKIKEAERSAT